MPKESNDGNKSNSKKYSSISIANTPLIRDVVGTARTFLEDIVLGIDAEDICNSMGVSSDKTFLLEGSPGTGKTMAIHALNNDLNIEYYKKSIAAQESNVKGMAPTIQDINMLMFEYSIGKHGSKYINESSKNLQNVFDVAKAYADNGIKTCIAFDEVDAIAGSRTSGIQTHSEDRKLLETLMKNLQVAHDTPNMYSILMTNIAGACDEASLRAGRIDKIYNFKLPNLNERRIGFENVIDSFNKSAGYNVVRKVNYDELAELSNGFNYADIKQCVSSSVKRRAMEIAQDISIIKIPAAYITQKRLRDGLVSHKGSFHKAPKIKKIGF